MKCSTRYYSCSIGGETWRGLPGTPSAPLHGADQAEAAYAEAKRRRNLPPLFAGAQPGRCGRRARHVSLQLGTFARSFSRKRGRPQAAPVVVLGLLCCPRHRVSRSTARGTGSLARTAGVPYPLYRSERRLCGRPMGSEPNPTFPGGGVSGRVLFAGSARRPRRTPAAAGAPRAWSQAPRRGPPARRGRRG